MKKLTSVVLSVLMVISLFGCLFTGTTVSATEEPGSTAATNLITNGNFESSFNVNTEQNNTCLPGLDNRSVNSFITDKQNGQWYCSKVGIAPSAAPDLDADCSQVDVRTTYPTYFGPNSQMVIEPTETGDSKNHVLRAVQDLYAQVDLKDNGKYTLSFRFKLPNDSTELTQLQLSLVSPTIKDDKVSGFETPFKITDANINSTQDISITTDDKGIATINFSDTLTEWQEVTITFTAQKNITQYTSPVFMKINFDKDENVLTNNVDESIANAEKYSTKAIYFDDFKMYETVGVEWVDTKGVSLGEKAKNLFAYVSADENELAQKTLTVNYDKSGAYAFKGWKYENKIISTDETYAINTSLYSDLSLLKAVMISANLLTGAASFENYKNGDDLEVELPTTDTLPNFSSGGKWGVNVNDGYYRATWKETIKDKDGKEYPQEARVNGKITDYNTFKVVENAEIANFGSKYLYVEGGGTSSLGLENLEKNTNYSLSFYWHYAEGNDSTISGMAITTTVNIGHATLGEYEGMKSSLQNVVNGKDLHSPIVMARNTDLTLNANNSWKLVTISFNSKDFNKLYFVMSPPNGGAPKVLIDDMTLVAMPKVDVKFVNTKGEDIPNTDCKNEAKPTITNSTEKPGHKPGHLVADATNYEDGAYDFRGWYEDTDCTQLVSSEKNFEFVNGKYSTLTAKVVSRNILTNAASFEGYNNETLTYADSAADGNGNFPPPTSDKWGTSSGGAYFIKSNNWFKISTVTGSKDEPYYLEGHFKYDANNNINYLVSKTVSPHSGNSMLRINTHSRSAIRKLTGLTKNTDYTLSFYVYDTSVKDYISSVGIANNYQGYRPEAANSYPALNIANISRKYAEGWQKVEISFNSGENTTLYLFIYQSASAEFANQGASFVDDLVCYKDNLTGDDLDIANITEYTTSNMRSGSDTVKQALRHKFEINKSLIDGGDDLYGEVVEYGSIAVPTSYLNGTELDKNGKYNEKDPAIGIAYKKDASGTVITNKIFAKDDTTITFTAALTGIGKNGNYATAYARSYTVRNYIIFRDRNTKKETVVYGDQMKASIFGIMAVILDQYQNTLDPSPQLQDDFTTVKGILNQDGFETTKTAFLELYAKYEELLKK